MKKTNKSNTKSLWEKIRRYNYVQAGEKIFFTMIGLWLALGLNNWNDARKKQRDERLMLTQLEAALMQDSKDIEETIQGYEYRVHGSTVILENLQHSSIVTDSLMASIQSLNGYSFLSANKGAYETLKSRGLDLIRNDSLRLDIATLYEVQYLNVERSEAFFQTLYSDQIIPYLYSHFQWQPTGLLPTDWPATQRDNYFRQLVNGAHFNNQNILAQYQALQKTIMALSEAVRRELE